MLPSKLMPFAAAALSLTLAACTQTPTPTTASLTDYASRPELQDAESQAILARYGNDPGLIGRASAGLRREARATEPPRRACPDRA